MTGIPRDPMILFSYLNTKLRDYYPSLRELCASLDLDEEKLTAHMRAAGYEYDGGKNQFI